MKIIWTETAYDDLKCIKEYIARDSDYYAIRVIEKLISSVEILEGFPELGRKVPETDHDNVREIIVKPYRIIYHLEGQKIMIVTIIHASRDLTNPGLHKWEIY